MGAAQFLEKPIDLMHLRPSVQKDEEGRVRKIIFSMHITVPDYGNSSFSPIWSPSAANLLSGWLHSQGKDSAEMAVGLDTLFDAEGCPLLTIAELTSQGFGNTSDMSAIGI
jgi:hypothetical protein